MKGMLFFALLSFSCLSASAQNDQSSGIKQLFSNTKTRLSEAEKKQVYTALGIALAPDKKEFVMAGDPDAVEYPFTVQLYPTDINNDGSEDLFAVYGNSYTSGMTGSNLVLFIKDKLGTYRSNFGFSGASPTILATKNAGYPEIVIGGPGFEFPVWKWNGKEYVFSRKIKEQALLKLKGSDLETISAAYVKTIK